MEKRQVVSAAVLLRREQHLASQPLGRVIHLFCCGSGDGDRSVFVKLKIERCFVALLHRALREAEPTAPNSEGNLIRAYLNNSVLRSVQSMGGCVAAKQRSPGGPKFGVK